MNKRQILEQAEKWLEDKKKLSATLGSEIESAPYKCFDEKTKAEYIRLYNRAKKNNPEIWTSTAQDFPASAYYDNEDFFRLLDIITQFDSLCRQYPEHKEELKELLQSGKWGRLDNIYSHCYWYCQSHDYVQDWKQMMKEILELEARASAGNYRKA